VLAENVTVSHTFRACKHGYPLATRRRSRYALSTKECRMSRPNDRLALAALALLLMPGPAMAQKQILADRPVTMETLLDRISAD
jgi:hypothetical protein